MITHHGTVCLGCQSGLARLLFQAEPERLNPAVAYHRPTLRGQQVSIESQGERLAGKLFLPVADRPAAVVIVCHGAGEWKENYFELCEHLAQRGLGALALDMRGHGQSDGERFCVDLGRWVADIRAAIDVLMAHPRVNGNRLAAFGVSSGGAAVLEAGMVDPRLKALIVLDPMVRNPLSWPTTLLLRACLLLGGIKRRLTGRTLRVPLAKLGRLRLTSDAEINRRIVSNPFSIEALLAFPLPGAEQAIFADTLERAFRVACPTLVLWGGDDRVVQPKHGRRLFQALTCKRQFRIIAGNGHLGHLDRHRARVFDLTADWVWQNVGNESVTVYAA